MSVCNFGQHQKQKDQKTTGMDVGNCPGPYQVRHVSSKHRTRQLAKDSVWGEGYVQEERRDGERERRREGAGEE